MTPAKGYWHCFGCQEGGDVIDFVRKIDHLSFAEAVENLPLAPVLSCGTKKEARQRPIASKGSAPDWSRPTKLPRSSTPSNSTVPMPNRTQVPQGTRL